MEEDHSIKMHVMWGQHLHHWGRPLPSIMLTILELNNHSFLHAYLFAFPILDGNILTVFVRVGADQFVRFNTKNITELTSIQWFGLIRF